ncbi:MAG: AI-2E family transporter [Alphaproteobacteria bacterium]|nr:AI-2E family transporter [Alphaproteobacteria bacterium]
MPDTSAAYGQFRIAFVLFLMAAIGVAFIALILDFVVAVLMAAVFSALLHPIYLKARRRLRTGPGVTSAIVMFFLLVAVGVPVFAFAGILAAEALSVSETVRPWLQQQIEGTSTENLRLPEWFPFSDQIEPYKTQILEKLGELASSFGQFLFNSIRAATSGTVGALLNIFVFLYAMFFFLMRGPQLFDAALRYFPLDSSDRDRLIERGLTVSQAILKSILIIGVLQGALVALAFWVLGIDGALFWGTIVLILSAIPGLGSVIVWAPGAIYLLAIDRSFDAVALVVWGALLVGLVDNVLRPRLVGGEAKIPDLFILLAILGGIGAFGFVGIIIGPIIAAVFLTVLDIYRSAFAELLPGSRHIDSDKTGPSETGS